jgi:hypothetical protein
VNKLDKKPLFLILCAWNIKRWPNNILGIKAANKPNLVGQYKSLFLWSERKILYATFIPPSIAERKSKEDWKYENVNDGSLLFAVKPGLQ